jgi:hypothetical protein
VLIYATPESIERASGWESDFGAGDFAHGGRLISVMWHYFRPGTAESELEYELQHSGSGFCKAVAAKMYCEIIIPDSPQ